MSAVALLNPHTKDIGGFEVRRLLPAPAQKMIGPFIFFDHMGPAQLAPGAGVDVRPHPHIGLATVTYLFEGALMHRDSLGTVQRIEPGAVNWMTAGHGIVHSERSAPTPTYSPILYLAAEMEAGASFELPLEHEERGVYAISGDVTLAGEALPARHLAVLPPSIAVRIVARSAARLMVVGGAAMDGDRHIWWNFVASSRELMDEAAERWRTGRFPQVPGESEFIPLPEYRGPQTTFVP